MEENISNAIDGIKLIDTKADGADLSEEDIQNRRNFQESFWKWSRMKEAFSAQRAKAKWLKEGDSNSRFLHACINKRRRDNTIHGLNIEGIWVEDAPRVKEHVYDFFKNRFNESLWPRPNLDAKAEFRWGGVQEDYKGRGGFVNC